MTKPAAVAALIASCPDDMLEEKLSIVSSHLVTNQHLPPFSCDAPALIVVCAQDDLTAILNVLRTTYPADFSIGLKLRGKVKWEEHSLTELSAAKNVEGIYLPVLDAMGSSEAFQEVVATLRAPDGCPWDREQTHQSLRPFLLEESYEMLDALDRGDMQGVKEELGDVLLQIYLHAQIASERGEFAMHDIVAAIANKMVRRHPHVFSTVDVNGDVGQVLRNWQDIKENERRENGEHQVKGILDGVPGSMSALLQAQTYQGRAAAVGFDWDSIEGVLEKVEEEVNEIRQAGNPEERAGEIGDLLFALVNLARWMDLDAESELRGTNQKFARRFAYIEQNARAQGRSLNEMTLAEMDVYWEQAKRLP
ncbi:MAG: nucleoside triphosphate pyrophosphohydrolase [Anaerolineae bacterium]|nr:nucleoside triphosphate pyrophosphohydrolase [Anaerolineae bacterium]